MPKKLPPYVDHYVDCRGRHRWYFRRGHGRRITLPPFGTPEFETAYAAALAASAAGRPDQRLPAGDRDTIAGLIASYMRSAAYRGLRQTSKTGYYSRLETIRRDHGHRTVSGMTRERIEKLILAPLADRPGAMLDTLKKLRILIRHAIEIGWLDRDPSLGIKRPKIDKIRSATDKELAAFRARWPIGTKQRLAFAIMLNVGLRRSDTHRLTWPDVAGGVVRVTSQKTGVPVANPVSEELQACLAVAPRDHITIINTEFGRPYTVDGFNRFMRDAMTAARLPLDCQPHGLRKAAGRRHADAGVSAHGIMAFLGHKSLAEAERYTEEADREHLARAAVARLEAEDARKANSGSLTGTVAFPNVAKNEDKSK